MGSRSRREVDGRPRLVKGLPWNSTLYSRVLHDPHWVSCEPEGFRNSTKSLTRGFAAGPDF